MVERFVGALASLLMHEKSNFAGVVAFYGIEVGIETAVAAATVSECFVISALCELTTNMC